MLLVNLQLIATAIPVITVHPNENGNITIAEGNKLELRCRATGDGKLHYQWMKVSGSLPKNTRIGKNGERLTIHNIKVSDSGEYYCSVGNVGGSVSSMKVRVTVKSKSLIMYCFSCLTDCIQEYLS